MRGRESGLTRPKTISTKTIEVMRNGGVLADLTYGHLTTEAAISTRKTTETMRTVLRTTMIKGSSSGEQTITKMTGDLSHFVFDLNKLK